MLENKICSVEGCSKPVSSSMLCGKHYQRKRRNGDVNYCKRDLPGNGYIVNGYKMYSRKRQGLRRVAEHVLIVEKALGKPIPLGAEIHHVNSIRHDNRNSNLVLCPNHAYHNLLHVRTNALEKCGNANFRKCNYCRNYDDPKNMYAHPSKQTSFWHKKCQKEYMSETRSDRSA